MHLACPSAAIAVLCCGLGCGPVVGPKAAKEGHARSADGSADDSPVASHPLSGARLVSEATALCSPRFQGRGSYQEGGRRAAAYIADEFRAVGLSIKTQLIDGGASNVFGILPGTSGDALIVSAHYDHLGLIDGAVYHGADDNASGTAVLLGLARAVSRDLGKPRHTIIFAAFGAEEDGLVGSGVYVAQPLHPLERTLAVINFDMVGRNFFEGGANTPDTAAVVGLGDVRGARSVARKAAAAQEFSLVEAPPRLLELFRLENRTDDWWFRRKQVPAIHFSTGLHDDYHQVSDTPEKLVPSQLENVARVALALIVHLTK